MTTTDPTPVLARKPCSECPWRRESARGWLGPHPVAAWVALALSDTAIACHKTIEIDETWTPKTLQCAGAADFRANIAKLPRDSAVLVGQRNDAVFALPQEFIDHHEGRR